MANVHKSISLVFDENINKTHEMKIPDRYSSFNIFTSDQGLCFLNQEALDDDGWKYVFDCFLFD